MPTKSATSVAQKSQKSAGVRRKRKYPSTAIVALNLAKCVRRDLTDLAVKLEVPKKHQKKKAKKNQRQENDQTLLSQEKDKTRKKISKMTRKKRNYLGKRFIKEFKYFSKSNENHSSRNRISYHQTLSWLKKAELLDNHRLTIRDVEVHYINKLKTGYELKILEFIRFLKSMCEDRGLDMPTVIFKLLNCREPTKSIKKKKMVRHSKISKRNKKIPCAPEKKMSTINALVEKSKKKVLNNEKTKTISKTTSAAVPETKDSSVLPSGYVRKKNNCGKKANTITCGDQNLLCDSIDTLRLNKIKGCNASDVNSNPLYCLQEFSKIYCEENFTNPLRDKTIAQKEHLKYFNYDWDLENIVSIEAIPTFYTRDYPISTERAAELVPTSAQTSANAVNHNDSRKFEMISTTKTFRNSASHNYKSPNVKNLKLGTKPNRHKIPIAMKQNVVVNKHGELKNSFTEEAGKIFEVKTEKESYEYIESDEADDSVKDKVQPLGSETVNSKKVGVKTRKVTKSRNKSLDKEVSEIVSIQHFDGQNDVNDGIKRNKRSFENIHKINKTQKKKSKFSVSSKNSILSKIKNCIEKIFSGELSGKMEESIQQLENENKKMSPNRKIITYKSRLKSELQESHKILIKSACGERDMKDQKIFKPNIKKTGKKETKNSSINECMLIEPPERKRKPVNNRTFTNLPDKHVQKCLQKLRKEKKLKMPNNQNASPISKSIQPTSGRKITSSKKHTMPTKCDTVKSKLIDGTRNERESEIQNSNIDANLIEEDISNSETDKHGMTKKKTVKRYKIRNRVRLSKKEFEDPVTEIQLLN